MMQKFDVKVFKGVTYARAERFGLPTAVPLGLFSGHERYGDCCPQYRAYHDESKKKNTLWYDEFRKGLNFTYSEDCLNLNIYAPATGGGHPVIIFVHGGSFVKGSSSERAFDGGAYAKRGVVMITVNYRLNVFGFYADDKVCNLAVYDLIAAINWVKRNAASFGGDPDNVTLAGQSAGAMLVQSLILNDEISPLIKGAVMMSGGGLLNGIFAPHSLKRAKKFFAKVKKEAEKDGGDIYTMPVEKLYFAWERVSGKHPLLGMLATMTCTDGKTVKKRGYSSLKNAIVPVIIGATKNDISPKKYLYSSADKYAAVSSAPVWLYRFNRSLPGDDLGAWHSSDLWYVFNTLSSHPYRVFDPRDYELSDEIVGRVCAFAYSHTPNAEEYETWCAKKLYVFE